MSEGGWQSVDIINVVCSQEITARHRTAQRSVSRSTTNRKAASNAKGDALPRCHIDARGIVSIAIGVQIKAIDDVDTDVLVRGAPGPSR